MTLAKLRTNASAAKGLKTSTVIATCRLLGNVALSGVAVSITEGDDVARRTRDVGGALAAHVSMSANQASEAERGQWQALCRLQTARSGTGKVCKSIQKNCGVLSV